MKSLQTLIEFNKENRQYFNDHFSLRSHRALSWLKKAEMAEDLDTKFIALWIAFNAAYAREIENVNTFDKAIFNEFIMRICSLDKEQEIYNLVWQKFSQSIRILLDNPYVYQPFWDYQNDKISAEKYQDLKAFEKDRCLGALEDGKTAVILEIMFNRLYTLRNQILHGGATFNSSVNREQLKDGCNILSLLIPAMLDIMMHNHGELDWGKPFYPVVK